MPTKRSKSIKPSSTKAILGNDEAVLRLAKKFRIFDLPIGVYVVAQSGRFLAANDEVQKMFGLSLKNLKESSIADFYPDRLLREALLTELNNGSGNPQESIKNVLPLRVSGREIFVQDYAKPLRDPRNQKLLGFVCCIADVTQEERYKKLFESLPIGIYRLDSNDRIA